jgi:hypothetical protein
MSNESSRSHVLSLFFLIPLIILSVAIPAHADSTVPWLTGGFASPGVLFSVTGTWQDYQWQLDLFPVLPDMTVTWSCDETYCEGYGGGPITGGAAYGQISSISLNTVLYSFTGEIYSGGAFREAAYCIPIDRCPSYTFDQYYVNFKGLWSNGWYTEGSDAAIDFEGYESDVTGWFDITTQTPEPATLTLLGAGIIGLAGYLRRSK